MTFIRSRSGLSNQHLFIGADAIVYLEGGEGYSRSDVDEGQYDNFSSDIRFWQSIFKLYLPKKKYQFRSIGSKATLLTIANDIKNQKIHNVIVAMDNDHDSINGKLINSDNVIYTYGYSWENDVWNNLTVVNTFRSLVGSCAFDEKDIQAQVEEFLKEFSSKIRLAVRLDIVLSQYGSSFFDRDKPGRYISLTRQGCPSINTQQLKASLVDARRNNARSVVRTHSINYDPIVNCFGHLVFDYCYRVVTFLVKSLTRLPRIAKEYVNSMAVEKFMFGMQEGLFAEKKAHYDSGFSRITT